MTPTETSAMPDRKPILTVEQQIAHLETKSVTFELMSKDDAAGYLTTKNNFLRVAAYREVFFLQADGDDAVKYLNLDFAYLVDLASIDRKLREVMLSATLDIEHFAKVKLLDIISNDSAEDGYVIVQDFLASQSARYRTAIQNELTFRGSSTSSDEYCGDLLAKYSADIPVWVFIEVVSFGAFLAFYYFCAQRWNRQDLLDEHYLLKQVKAMRNASAHGLCIINGFRPGLQAKVATSLLVMQSLSSSGLRSSKNRKAKLENPRIQQIAVTLYAYSRLVNSEKALARTTLLLRDLLRRTYRNKRYYTKTNALVSFFDFLARIIDIWFPLAQDTCI